MNEVVASPTTPSVLLFSCSSLQLGWSPFVPAPAGANVATTPTDAMLTKNKLATIPRAIRAAPMSLPFTPSNGKDSAR